MNVVLSKQIILSIFYFVCQRGFCLGSNGLDSVSTGLEWVQSSGTETRWVFQRFLLCCPISFMYTELSSFMGLFVFFCSRLWFFFGTRVSEMDCVSRAVLTLLFLFLFPSRWRHKGEATARNKEAKKKKQQQKTKQQQQQPKPKIKTTTKRYRTR